MSVRISCMRDTRGRVFIYDFSHQDWFEEDYVWERMSGVLDKSRGYHLGGNKEKPIISRGELTAEVFIEPIVKGSTRVRVVQGYDHRDAGMTRMIKKCLFALEDDVAPVHRDFPGFESK